MVDFIKRDKDDIFGKKILGFFFKNQKFLIGLRVVVLALFFYAIFLGFSDSSKDNLFTSALFWGIFWSFFMVTTLPTFGRIFCSICPHGFMGKYITKFGLKKKMPKWMQNRFFGLLLLVLGWWGVYYVFPGIYRTPFGTAMLFTAMTLFSFVIYFLYRDMSYCKYICPIGTVTRAFSKLSFTWLGTYKSACSECKTFDCATACPYNLKPFTFDKKNSMEDCTLCMECTIVCESVNLKFKKPSFSLFKKFKSEKVEIWAYILILASIPIAMAFHHGIGRSKVAHDMIWYKTAEIFMPLFGKGVDIVGLFAYLYAMVFTILAATVGMYIASKILKKSFKDIFYNLGYSYAPLFIFASMGHALSGFFTRGYERIVEGFAWAFGVSIKVAPLAKRDDDWLMIFNIFKWVAIIWALVILYRRFKLIKADKIKKIFAFPFAALLIIFYFGVNQYRTHIMDTYGRATSGMHGARHGGNKNRHGSKSTTLEVNVKDTLFFTDRDPSAKRRMGGMGMMMRMGGSRTGVPKRSFWLATKRLNRPNCVKNIDGKFYVTNIDGELINPKIKSKKGCTCVTFEVPTSGYYTLYYVQKTDGMTNVAKYEYKRFNHGGDDVFSKDKIKARALQDVPFDILRLRDDSEDSFFYSLHTGQVVKFKVLKDGKAVRGARVTLKTQLGWQKSTRTNKDGIAKLELIQDYNPKWEKFNKRFREKFIVTVNYRDKDGKYKASYIGVYRPSRESYQSYAYALVISIILLLFLSFGVFAYRYKVQKPFKEVRFDETSD